MSQKETTDTIGRLEVSGSQNGNLSKLAELARQAYEQKRTKDCLDLTRAMLLLDPDNADAQRMRFSIQSEMHQDLENARAFLRQAHSKENSAQQSQPGQTAVPAHLDLVPDSEGSIPSPAVPANSSRVRGTRWLVGAIVLLCACVMIASLPRLRSNSNHLDASLLMLGGSGKTQSENSAHLDSVADPVLNPVLVNRSADVETPPVVVAAPSPARVTPSTPTALAPAPVPPPAPTLSDRPVVAANGTLAISSPTSVDIYENDAYLGSAPVSLVLTAGAHTLEYRHGSLRRSLTHVINGNETVKAAITFDVSVQINSKPWAEVFTDGADRKDLGQTPLSGVRVPIGSVLVFENPQFQAKKYRVTGNETGIQVVFP